MIRRIHQAESDCCTLIRARDDLAASRGPHEADQLVGRPVERYLAAAGLSCLRLDELRLRAGLGSTAHAPREQERLERVAASNLLGPKRIQRGGLTSCSVWRQLERVMLIRRRPTKQTTTTNATTRPISDSESSERGR